MHSDTENYIEPQNLLHFERKSPRKRNLIIETMLSETHNGENILIFLATNFIVMKFAAVFVCEIDCVIKVMEQIFLSHTAEEEQQ